MPIPLPPDVKKLLSGKVFPHLATINPDGSPQVSVVWVDVDGDRILVNTAEGRIKPRNVRRDPRVALSVTPADNPYGRVQIQGRVIDMRHEGAAEHIDRMAKKYRGQDSYDHQPGEQRVIMVIEADRIASRL